MSDFKNSKAGVGLKPMISFSGSIFENNPTYAQMKLLFLDFFHGNTVPEVDVESLQYMISISAADPTDENPNPKIHFRTYMLKTMRSGHKLPRVELEEMGPRMDFKIGRIQEANPDFMKQAMQKAKGQEMRTKKNISIDPMGDKIGKIHVDRQDLGKLQTRKMKGLKKRSRNESDDEDDDIEMEDGDVDMGDDDLPAISPKRAKV
ncbi:hypothetical protein AA313_de0208939 [Arthrobotrys entomopaga]|nr:hypothetical protein AA313_de0208939 [Arthrobotrys entomopaga]